MFYRFKIKIFAFVIALAAFSVSCGGGEPKPTTPLETFKAYTKAIKQKDTRTMMKLLSDGSIKMHKQEAEAQNLNLDDVVKRQTLFSESQKTVEHRNEKIEGDRASLEVKNSFGAWENVPFVLEDGVWKIDKQGFANQMMQQIEQDKQKLDDIINQGRQP